MTKKQKVLVCLVLGVIFTAGLAAAIWVFLLSLIPMSKTHLIATRGSGR